MSFLVLSELHQLWKMFRRMSLEVGKAFRRVQTGDAYETRLVER